MHISYRSKTYTWNDVILVKRSMIGSFFIVSHSSCLVTWYACCQLQFNYRIANDTWPDTRTMVLRNSRSIQKHRRPIKVQLSYREWHVTGRAQPPTWIWENRRDYDTIKTHKSHTVTHSIWTVFHTNAPPTEQTYRRTKPRGVQSTNTVSNRHNTQTTVKAITAHRHEIKIVRN